MYYLLTGIFGNQCTIKPENNFHKIAILDC